MPYHCEKTSFAQAWICVVLMTLLMPVLVACSSQPQPKVNLQRLDLKLVELAAPNALINAAARGDALTVRRELEAGALINAVSPVGTAFSQAMKAGHETVSLFLLSLGADTRSGFAPDETSALILAASRGHNQLAKELLIRGADLEALDPEGYTALARAAINGHLTTLKVLINAGAKVDVVAEGRSILMRVVQANNMLLAQVLIAAQADVNFRDERGDTALRIARHNKFFDIDLMLVQAGARL